MAHWQTVLSLGDWRIERGADGIVWLWFDKASASTNTLRISLRLAGDTTGA